MKKLMMCGVLALCGLFACVEQPMPSSDPDNSSEVSESQIPGSITEGVGSLCCIDYTCPTDGFETTGCKSGSSGPGPAFRACQAHCGRICDAGEWTCL